MAIYEKVSEVTIAEDDMIIIGARERKVMARSNAYTTFLVFPEQFTYFNQLMVRGTYNNWLSIHIWG